MARLYRRGRIWWWRCERNGKAIRETTRTTNEEIANKFMIRRLEEIDGHKIDIKLPKVLILDIETAPLEVYSWTYWPNFIDPISQVVKNKDGSPKDWSILTWAAKWLFESHVYSGQVTLAEAKKRKDKSLIKPLWDLFEEADVIIAHNGDKFDIRRCAWRFKINGLGPPSPFQTIDTLKVAKKAFGTPSYKQDYLNRSLGLRRKIETDFELWERCVNGDQTGLDEMLLYNIGDVAGLEDLYLEIRAWVRGPVNLSMYGENHQKQCHNCLSVELKMLNKPYTTPAGQYESYRCLRCGAIGRERYMAKTLKQRKNSILATAR
jgi:hypothetical protein